MFGEGGGAGHSPREDLRPRPSALASSDQRTLARFLGGPRRRSARAPGGGHPAGLQDGGHLRRRVRGLYAVLLLHLRGRERGRARRARAGHDPRQRAQPDRPGHRVRLLLRARRACAPRDGLRDDHGQLQPRDGLHRLRHLRPALLRAAHLRGRAQHRRERAAHGSRSSSSAARRRCSSRSGWKRPACRSSALPPDAIDLAEDRGRFGALLDELGITHPQYGTARQPRRGASRSPTRIGYPLLVRPSYVLGGRAMEIVYSEEELEQLHGHGVKRQPRTSRAASTSSWRTPSRSTWMRSPTARTSSSAA